MHLFFFLDLKMQKDNIDCLGCLHKTTGYTVQIRGSLLYFHYKLDFVRPFSDFPGITFGMSADSLHAEGSNHIRINNPRTYSGQPQIYSDYDIPQLLHSPTHLILIHFSSGQSFIACPTSWRWLNSPASGLLGSYVPAEKQQITFAPLLENDKKIFM